ncbi:hypothetical protein DMC63_33640 [Streptomyces sp. WAC 05977]|nr:hypothetical protein DMC63_33640 [Streptomyces sp. WAC 05977]
MGQRAGRGRPHRAGGPGVRARTGAGPPGRLSRGAARCESHFRNVEGCESGFRNVRGVGRAAGTGAREWSGRF